MDNPVYRQKIRKFLIDFFEKFVRFLKELRRGDVALMLTAGAIHHMVGFAWGYNATVYFDQHLGAENGGSVRTYLMIIIVICGISGTLIGGTITDYLGKRKTLQGNRPALIVMIASSIFSAPFFALGLYFHEPYCFIFIAIGSCASGRHKIYKYCTEDRNFRAF